MATLDQLIEDKIQASVFALLQGPPGPEGPPGRPSPFPPWSTGEGHFGTGYQAYAEARDQIATRLAGLPEPSGAKVPAGEALPASGPNSNSYCDVLRLAEADSYFVVPYSRSTPFIYRARINRFVPVESIANPVAGGQSGGCVLPSGRVLMAPYCSDRLIAYDPRDDALHTLESGLTGAFKWAPPALGRAGVAVMAPHLSKCVAVYDERAAADSRWWTSQPLPVADYAFGGAPIALPCGRKFLFVPYNEARLGIFDLDTGMLNLGPPAFPGGDSQAFWGGRHLGGTRALLYPHKADRPWIVDYASGEVVPFPVATGTTGIAGFNGGVALADGRDWLVPFQSPQARLLDVANGRVSIPPGSFGGGACKGGCLMDDGHVLAAPFNADTPIFAMTGHGLPLDPELVTSPHQNRS